MGQIAMGIRHKYILAYAINFDLKSPNNSLCENTGNKTSRTDISALPQYFRVADKNLPSGSAAVY